MDTTWVAAVLPQHQWDIAEKLARVSVLRRRQQEILASAGARDAAVAGLLRAQQRAQGLVVAGVERHVAELEDLARRARRADAARRARRRANVSHRALVGPDHPGTHPAARE